MYHWGGKSLREIAFSSLDGLIVGGRLDIGAERRSRSSLRHGEQTMSRSVSSRVGRWMS